MLRVNKLLVSDARLCKTCLTRNAKTMMSFLVMCSDEMLTLLKLRVGVKGILCYGLTQLTVNRSIADCKSPL
jgi:hypothetical protein